MAKEQRYCIFCGGNKLSHEHIWPDWIAPHLTVPPNPKYSIVSHGTTADNLKDLKQTSKRIFQGPLHTATVKRVCETCNNEWMSKAEERAKPMLLALMKGEKREFSIPEQRILARWISIKVTVTEYSLPNFACTPQHHRTQIMQDNFKYPGWRIWLVSNLGMAWNAQLARNALRIAQMRPDGTPDLAFGSLPKNVQSVTIGIDKVVFHVITTTIQNAYFKLPDEVIDNVIDLLPIKGNFHWPPNKPFSDAAIENLSMAIDRSGRRLKTPTFR